MCVSRYLHCGQELDHHKGECWLSQFIFHNGMEQLDVLLSSEFQRGPSLPLLLNQNVFRSLSVRKSLSFEYYAHSFYFS